MKINRTFAGRPLLHSHGSCHSARNSGILLVECMVYLAVFAIIFTLALALFFRTLNNTEALNRNAADIIQTLRAGEQWREDVRSAAGPLEFLAGDGAELMRIPQQEGELLYRFEEGRVARRKDDGAWINILPRVKSSKMHQDAGRHVTSWRWELELESVQKAAHVQPLFTFQSVAAYDFKP
jgi:hypothetical protein